MKFLMITPPGSGQMIPHMNLTKELQSKGHQVVWAMPKPVMSRLENAGLSVFEAGPENLNFENRDLYCPGHSNTSGFEEFILTADKLIMQPTIKIVDDILRQCTKEDFDAIISEVGSPAGPILSELWEIPWICVSTESLAYISEGIPPYAFEDELESGRPMEEFYEGHRFIRDRYNDLRAHFQLDPVQKGWNDLFSPLLTICVTTRELEYPNALIPEGLVFTGPLSNIAPDPNLDPVLEEFIQKYTSEKILYATLGTVFNKYPNLMNKLIEGVYLSGATAIISTGPGYQISEELLAKKPDNVLIVAWANHRALFPYITAAVTHGGMSTTCDTISFGLPTVHLPVGCDLPSLSRKLVYQKAGLRIPHKIATPELISNNIHELLTSKELYVNIAELQQSFKNAGGAKRAIELIEETVFSKLTQVKY